MHATEATRRGWIREGTSIGSAPSATPARLCNAAVGAGRPITPAVGRGGPTMRRLARCVIASADAGSADGCTPIWPTRFGREGSSPICRSRMEPTWRNGASPRRGSCWGTALDMAGPASWSVSEPKGLDGPAVGSESPKLMRKVALLTCLTLASAALAGIAGVVTAEVADSGSALVVVVVVALGALIIGLLERTHRRGSGSVHAFHGADLGVSADRQGVGPGHHAGPGRATSRSCSRSRPGEPLVGRDPHRRNGARRRQPRPALRLSTASDRQASRPSRVALTSKQLSARRPRS